RSDEYFQTKTTIFNALIDTIDLSQLAQLDTESAAEDCRLRLKVLIGAAAHFDGLTVIGGRGDARRR
ncbi:MAG: hypothetical protein AAGJ87_03115, partial [Pseudomonadota bacterium]